MFEFVCFKPEAAKKYLGLNDCAAIITLYPIDAIRVWDLSSIAALRVQVDQVQIVATVLLFRFTGREIRSNMCDPLSVTASTLTVVGFAAQSCQLLSNFFYSFYDAPKDLQHHIAALHALRSTFAGIATLEKEIPDTSCFTPDFCVRLRDCILDFQVTERRLKSLCTHLEEGSVRRIWTRVKWSSIDQTKIKKFLARVESYHATFSLDLLLLNM